MSRKTKTGYIVGSVLLSSLLMSLVDGVLQPGYAVKSAIKITLFLLIPLVYFFMNRGDGARLKSLFLPQRKTLGFSLLLGLGVYAVILMGYFLLRRWIDFSAIAASLTETAGVNAGNFVFVALYISFVNSLLEEFFFRGYAFLTLRDLTSRPFAYLFSALLFALYHTGMTAGWFSPALWLLSLAGLFVGGCIFNLLNEKNGTLLTSWLVHMCANFAINTIGFLLFGIL